MPGKYNFVYLAGALVLLLALIALAREFHILLGQVLFQIMIVGAMSVAAWSVSSELRWRVTGSGFIAVLIVLTIVGMFLKEIGLDILWLAVLGGYLLLTTVLAVRKVLFTESVDWNKVAGALCIFLLIGLIWSVLYMIIVELTPGAFNGIAGTRWDEVFPDLIYFSVVTLTTLGYGDITPVTPLVRFLAFMEAVIGQLYIAVVVASLVGIRIAQEIAADVKNDDDH